MKETTNPLLKDALAACRGGFVAVALFSLCINLLMLTVPLYMLQLFDRVLASRSTETLILLTVIAVAAVLTLAALEVVRTNALVRISTWLDRKLGGPVLTCSIAASLRQGKDPSVQGLRDLSTFRTFLTGPAIFPILDSPWTPIFIAIVFVLHPLLGWIALGGALVLFALAVSNELATRNLMLLSGGSSIKALHQAEAAARNADVIEAMGMMPNLVRRWHRQNTETLALQARASNRSGGITALSKFARLCLQIGMLGAGAWLVILGEITPGVMIAATILMGRALAPVEQAIGAWRSTIAARDAYHRVKRQLDETPPRGEAMLLPAPSGRLTVEGLAFVYPGASEPVLKGITFDLGPGEAMGLIGPSAAGKTTLARLLIGNFQPRAGHVRLDEVDVAQWEPEDLGRHIGYLPQDVELFSGTVHLNIARMGEADPESVIEAARLAGVHEMVLRLPKGYETEIGEGGTALSGGERQRIALARAVYGTPRFVVLDEPNASLDQTGEESLLKAIDTLKKRGVTVVVIANRPSILRHVGKILILRNGTVQTFGARDEVIAQLTGPAAGAKITGTSTRRHG